MMVQKQFYKAFSLIYEEMKVALNLSERFVKGKFV